MRRPGVWVGSGVAAWLLLGGCTVDRLAAPPDGGAWQRPRPPRTEAGVEGGADGAWTRDGGRSCVSDEDCQDGRFCNGRERCDPASGRCLSASRLPCEGVAERCDEAEDRCVDCTLDAHCDDGDWCNGTERCRSGTCVPGTPPCPMGERRLCDEAEDRCVQCTLDAHCDDGNLCNGRERCDLAGGTCLAGTAPCAPGEGCDPATGRCFQCVGDGDCGRPPGPCTRWACQDGRCVERPRADGTPCDDGRRCTRDDQCVAGACQGTEVRCPSGVCSESLGCGGQRCRMNADCGGACDPAWCNAFVCSRLGGSCRSTAACREASVGPNPKVCTCCY